jgi:predicted GIY-YIG superfamily endonuclease
MAKRRVIYLLHFERAYHHAKHYIGSTSDLETRLADHRNGQVARLLQVINDAGISWSVVRTWKGSRLVERKIKQRKQAPDLCPICAGEKAMKRCVNPAKGADGYLIIDDVLIPKPFTKLIAFCAWDHDHSQHRHVFGQRLSLSSGAMARCSSPCSLPSGRKTHGPERGASGGAGKKPRR